MIMSYSTTISNIELLQIFRDQESSKENSHLMAMNDSNKVAAKSNGSDCSYVQSVSSSSVDDVDSTLSPGEVETMVRWEHFSYHQCSICTYCFKFLSMHN